MILKDKLYRLKNLKQEEDQLIADIVLNEKDIIFEGHFPGNPITPGVAQLEIIKEILSIHFNRSIQLKSISNCKYLAILNPLKNPDVTVTLTVNKVENELKVNAVFAANGTVFTKSTGVYY